jgi:cell division protease FtsH
MTGADCERIVRLARRRARAEMRTIKLQDLITEISGLETRSSEDLWIASVHEAGHAVAMHILRPKSLVSVTIRQTEAQGGYVYSGKWESAYIRKTDIEEQLLLLLMGRAAEHEFFGEPTSGSGGQAGSDLAQATAIAVLADSAYGFSDGGGLVWRGHPEGHRLQQVLSSDADLSKRVSILLDKTYSEARRFVVSHKAGVKAIATELMERGTLRESEVTDILDKRTFSTTVTPTPSKTEGDRSPPAQCSDDIRDSCDPTNQAAVRYSLGIETAELG